MRKCLNSRLARAADQRGAECDSGRGVVGASARSCGGHHGGTSRAACGAITTATELAALANLRPLPGAPLAAGSGKGNMGCRAMVCARGLRPQQGKGRAARATNAWADQWTT